jgi:two-component system response regulator AtoC
MRILIVEDDDALSELLGSHCRDRGHRVDRVKSGHECLSALDSTRPDCVFLDVRLGDANGLDLLPQIKDHYRETRVTVMTGYEPLPSASLASARGAEHFLRKPFDLAELDGLLDNLEGSGTRAPGDAGDPDGDPEVLAPATFIGTSRAMTNVCRAVGLSARTGVTTLIEGESGVGKELAARAIHALGGGERPFSAVDCASIVETLFESELFGHEKGAFTGAHVAREGKVKLAEGGILFLDEIPELTPRMQAKLLRLLQTRTYEPVGGSARIPVSFQLVAATNRNLTTLVEQGVFRQDLYHRLNVLRIEIPPLRERREDVPALVSHFLRQISRRIRIADPVLRPDALAALVAHGWPGNVREVENVVTRLILEAQGRAIDRPTVARTLGNRSASAPTRTLSEIEKSTIQASLEHTGWNHGETCSLLGISRPTLRRKIALYRLRR